MGLNTFDIIIILFFFFFFKWGFRGGFLYLVARALGGAKERAVKKFLHKEDDDE